MTDVTTTDEQKTWKCDVCSKEFLSYHTFYKHTKLKKSACVSQEKCIEFVEILKQNETRFLYYETKMQRKDDKIKQLEEELTQLKKLNEIKDYTLRGLNEKLNEIKESVSSVHNKIDNKNATVNIAYNNYITNNRDFITVNYS